MSEDPYISNPYSTGGGGYDFEILVGTFYLISMLKRSVPLGLNKGFIEGISFQAKYNGHLLDDIVLKCSNNCTLSIQVRHDVKFTKKNTEFNSLLKECLKNFKKPDFNPAKDKNCIVVGVFHININQIRKICKYSETSLSHDEFLKKIKAQNFLDIKGKELFDVISGIIKEDEGHNDIKENHETNVNIKIWKFFKSFLILHIEIESDSATHYNQSLNNLGDLLKNPSRDQVPAFSYLKNQVAKYDKYAGSFNYNSLFDDISSRFAFKESKILINEDEKPVIIIIIDKLKHFFDAYLRYIHMTEVEKKEMRLPKHSLDPFPNLVYDHTIILETLGITVHTIKRPEQGDVITHLTFFNNKFFFQLGSGATLLNQDTMEKIRSKDGCESIIEEIKTRARKKYKINI